MVPGEGTRVVPPAGIGGAEPCKAGIDVTPLSGGGMVQSAGVVVGDALSNWEGSKSSSLSVSAVAITLTTTSSPGVAEGSGVSTMADERCVKPSMSGAVSQEASYASSAGSARYMRDAG